jgi:hypothetical protein
VFSWRLCQGMGKTAEMIALVLAQRELWARRKDALIEELATTLTIDEAALPVVSATLVVCPVRVGTARDLASVPRASPLLRSLALLLPCSLGLSLPPPPLLNPACAHALALALTYSLCVSVHAPAEHPGPVEGRGGAVHRARHVQGRGALPGPSAAQRRRDRRLRLRHHVLRHRVLGGAHFVLGCGRGPGWQQQAQCDAALRRRVEPHRAGRGAPHQEQGDGRGEGVLRAAVHTPLVHHRHAHSELAAGAHRVRACVRAWPGVCVV